VGGDNIGIILTLKILSMKKTKLGLIALALSIGILMSFDNMPTSTIKGTVSPADKALRAWAISFDDTLTVDVENGVFEIRDVKPGTYAVIIEAQEPFANVRKRDVEVSRGGQVTDMGEIALMQRK
jgi:hypothetical protein